MKYSHKATLKEHKAPIYSLCEGERSHIVYSGGGDQYVVKWDLQELKAQKVVSKAPTTIISLLYIKQFNYLLIGQVEGGVHIIDLNTNKELRYLKIHKGYIFDIVYIESKKELVFSSGDGTISIWSVPDFKLLYQTQIGKGKNRKIDYSADRNELAVASADGFVQLMNVEDWSVKSIIEPFGSPVNSVHYGHTSQLLVGDKNAHLHEIDLKENKKLRSIPAHNWAIYDISKSSEGVLATASRDKTVKIWDESNWTVIKRFEGLKDKGHTHSVNKLLWTSFNHYLLSAGDDHSIRVWQVER